jgi:hypothetical protein
MPGAVVGTQMNNGFPGTFSRNGKNRTRAFQVLSTDSAGPAFGNAVVLNQNNTGGTISDAAISIGNGHTPVMTQGANYAFVGFAVREVLTQVATYNPAQPLTPLIQTYAPGQTADILEEGSMTRVVTDPQVAGYKSGQSVYLRVTTNGSYPSAAVGDIETAADGAHTIQLTNVFMTTGIVDANNVVELTILVQNTP